MDTVSSSSRITAAEIRQTSFPTRLGGHPAEAVRRFLTRVADTVEELEQREAQLEDQLLIAEADRHTASDLRRRMSEAEAEARSFADRTVLAETMRDAALARQSELEAQVEELSRREPIVIPVPAMEAVMTQPVDPSGAEQVMKDAAEAAARTRSDAHAQARQILAEAQKAAEQVRTEQQRWAGEAERSLRIRLDEMAAEADSRFLDARDAAARILTSAGEEAERIIEHASSEADRMLSEARTFSTKLMSAAQEQAAQDWPTDVVPASGRAAATLTPVNPPAADRPDAAPDAPVTLRAVDAVDFSGPDDVDDAAGDDGWDGGVGDALADAADLSEVVDDDETVDEELSEPAERTPMIDTEALLAKAEQLLAAAAALGSDRVQELTERIAALRRDSV